MKKFDVAYSLGIAAVVSLVALDRVHGQTDFQVSRCRECAVMSRGGLVVTYSSTPGMNGLLVWNATKPTAPPQELTSPKTGVFAPRCINDEGLVVAHTFLPGTDCFCPVVWDTKHPAAAPKELPIPVGVSCRARAINDKGVIAGVTDMDGDRRAILWITGTQSAAPIYLPTPKGKSSEVVAINDDGLVAGNIRDEDEGRAVVWDANKPTAAPQYLSTTEGNRSYAATMNGKGLVAGVTGNAAVVWNACNPKAAPRRLAKVTGIDEDLPFFGKPRVFLKSINDKGQVVGIVQLYTENEPLITSGPIAILWDGETEVVLGAGQEGIVEAVQGINNQGQIIVVCRDRPGGEQRTCLLTPIASGDGGASPSRR